MRNRKGGRIEDKSGKINGVTQADDNNSDEKDTEMRKGERKQGKKRGDEKER